MTNPAYEATNSDVEKLINSEIADFFAGFGHPGEPETPQEMQQQLQSRISAIFNAAPNGMMQLSNELAEMKRKCAELELKLANPVLLPKTNGYWTEQEKAYEDAITLAKRQIRLAGFRCEGDE